MKKVSRMLPILLLPILLGGGEKDPLLLYFNKAERKELLKIPQINEKLAEKIIEKRKSIGHFSKRAQLLSIKGMGKKRLLLIEYYIKGKKININSAPLHILCNLPHIGEKTARRIIEYREKKKIESAEDLLKIKGLGEKKVKDILPFIVFK